MNYFKEIETEAGVVAEQLRPVLNGTHNLSRLRFEQHDNSVAAVFWTGHHFERVVLTCPTPTTQHILTGGLESARLLWRYQDAVADALRLRN